MQNASSSGALDATIYQRLLVTHREYLQFIGTQGRIGLHNQAQFSAVHLPSVDHHLQFVLDAALVGLLHAAGQLTRKREAVAQLL